MVDPGVDKDLARLHDRDFNLWIEEVKCAIASRNFENMDWDNLLDAIDDMGKSQKRSLESYLELLIAHILKLQYWESEKEKNYKHWQVEVVNFRNRIRRLLKQNPSFNKYMQEVYSEIFADAVKSWQIEFNIPEDSFINLEQIMQDNYFG